MKVNRFEFVDREESSKFQRVPTRKQYVTGVSPYAETMQIEAVDRTPPSDHSPDAADGE